jgi:hypothetical protein
MSANKRKQIVHLGGLPVSCVWWLAKVDYAFIVPEFPWRQDTRGVSLLVATVSYSGTAWTWIPFGFLPVELMSGVILTFIKQSFS